MAALAADRAREMADRSTQIRRAKSLERHIRTVVGSLPPLTAKQRTRLAALLAPTDPRIEAPAARDVG